VIADVHLRRRLDGVRAEMIFSEASLPASIILPVDASVYGGGLADLERAADRSAPIQFGS